jgi:hypothetical protein
MVNRLITHLNLLSLSCCISFHLSLFLSSRSYTLFVELFIYLSSLSAVPLPVFLLFTHLHLVSTFSPQCRSVIKNMWWLINNWMQSTAEPKRVYCSYRMNSCQHKGSNSLIILSYLLDMFCASLKSFVPDLFIYCLFFLSLFLLVSFTPIFNSLLSIIYSTLLFTFNFVPFSYFLFL